MKKANKNPIMEWGFTRFNRLFLSFHFEHIRLWSRDAKPFRRRTLFLVNHSTWWDPLFIFYLNDRIIQSDGYAMMHEDGLKKHPFFQTIGGYSINGDDRRHVFESLNYSIEQLKDDKTVWIFPQGQEEHLEKRPLDFFSGTALIAKRCPGVQVVPISLYYSLEHTRKPNAYIKIGESIDSNALRSMNRKELTLHFEEVCTAQLNELRKAVIEENHSVFEDLLNRKGG
ncbi:lysophospholipid acyltransferase family protein [Halobacillus litoralis]|uniref:lysophospholipid acyltransferase family protein n=1 Tax=Halobacillus litoralis TaxID=45668 RepID=UPI001CD7265D|nr:lysophospholipid acyltransferase family protein [Halobacillus litoralis]MCA0969476.1 lysophospholipid acyltransferase family protein [Halobacillus litoralis]